MKSSFIKKIYERFLQDHRGITDENFSQKVKRVFSLSIKSDSLMTLNNKIKLSAAF